MTDLEVSCMDCHSDLLGSGKIGEERPSSLDCGVAGTSEVEGGGGRMICLNVSFPLKACVS